MSLKDGKGLTRVTPENMRVIDHAFNRDLGLLFVRLYRDSDLDGSYAEEDDQVLLKVNVNKLGVGTPLVDKEMIKRLESMLLN